VDGSGDSLIEQALRHQSFSTHTAPPSGRELLGRIDMLKAAAIGGIVGLLLRAGLDMTVSGAGLMVLWALATGQDARAATPIRLWILGGVLATLGSGALTAVLVRRHRALWVLVSMVCVALPLLVP
jgi:hypothetical protein